MVGSDMTERAELAGLLDRIATGGPPLAAVIHAAGTGRNTAVADTTMAELAEVMAGKVAGAVHLDELTRDLDLEQFVLFSSAAATWGSGGEGGYSAANEFLNGLASARLGRGLPAASVGWGPWSGGGLITPGSEALLKRRGLPLLDPELAIGALGQYLDAGATLLTVAHVDWPRFTQPFTLRRPSPLIESLPEVRQALAEADANAAADGGSAAEAGSALEQQLAGLPPAEQDRVLVNLVRSGAAAVLGHSSTDAVEAGRAFSELGFDSLTAVELRDRLNGATGLRLPATLLFDYPTPAVVAEFLRPRLTGDRARQAPVPVAVPVVPAVDEPVAIVGMGCRFPGGVRSPEDLWRLVASGTDAIAGIPADRGWNLGASPGADLDPAAARALQGGFMDDVAEFDPEFFGISPREALAMDPQQRLLLEVSWEAIEGAGIGPAALRGSVTGVFAGAATSGYAAAMDRAGEGGEVYLMTGNAGSVISGRVSYALGLEGPAVTVDTACSSALVALHLACQAVRAAECDLALAGGVMVMVDPGVITEFHQMRGLSSDGRCKAFGAAADGMGAGEGVGVVVLERLSDARRNGHPVLAVVAGSAINQDGASNGLTAPNGPSQQRVIRAALASAGLQTHEVDAVEAHGTGTELGDPIEAGALLATYGQDRPEGRPLWLGTVKSNIGHTQAAAGAAGVIKTVLALQHGLLPPTLHAAEPSPHVDWTAGDVRLLTEATPWPVNGHPRRAGVSSFGLSGTNAHVILEEAPAAGAQVPAADPVPVVAGSLAWLVSAPVGGGPGGPGRPAGRARGGPSGPGPGRRGLVAGHHPVGVRASRGDHRCGPGRAGRGPGRGGRRAARGRRDHRGGPAGRRGAGRVPLRRAGVPAGRDGRGAARGVAGVRGRVRPGVRAAGGASWGCRWPRWCWARIRTMSGPIRPCSRRRGCSRWARGWWRCWPRPGSGRTRWRVIRWGR